jgi:putative SOS response-associated peptidase YedK
MAHPILHQCDQSELKIDHELITFVLDRFTVPSNELVAQIHNRMPAILEPRSYDRWLSTEPDPHGLLITYPSEPMTMWPTSTRVNKPENDDRSILDRAAEPVNWQAPLNR